MGLPGADALREYSNRRWDELARLKARFVEARGRAQTLNEAFELSAQLWQHMRRLDPDWPNDGQRDADLAHHRELVQRMRHISDVLFPR